MLSVQENELITKCGPGTPMGELMRQYWIPAAQSNELLEVDGAPLRVRLLNENLIAFRTTSGKVGLVDDYCPHRGASMFYGRNEEDGLRCVYHGWKFDTTGQCVDMMNEAADSTFPSKVTIKAYPTHERNGIIWAYMGPRQTPPALPDLEANMVADGGLPGTGPSPINTTLNQYNWLQAMENNMDTAHNPILHFGAVTPENFIFGEKYGAAGDDVYHMVKERAARFLVRDHDVGCSYGAFRPADDGTSYWRTMHWLFPFYTMSPVPKLGSIATCAATVPIDDYHCMSWGMRVVVGEGAVPGGRTDGPNPSGNRSNLPNTSDWLGRFRSGFWNESVNDFGIDRQLQRDKPANVTGFTGLPNVSTQDEAMRWSQGRAEDHGIVDRNREHLGTTDAMIIRVRKSLLDAAEALVTQGRTPPGVDNPNYYGMRSGWIVLSNDVDWWEATRDLREAFRMENPSAIGV